MGDWLRAAYQERRALQESKGGDATFFEIGANAPHMLEWYFKSFYEGVFYGGRVEVRIKELLRYRLSMTHGCAFCNKGNVEAARRAGVTDVQLDIIMNDASDVFDERERAVLRLGAEMALPNMKGQLTPALYADLSAHFDDGEIFELRHGGGGAHRHSEVSLRLRPGGARGALPGGSAGSGITTAYNPKAPGLIRFFGSSVRLTASTSARWPGSMRSR